MNLSLAEFIVLLPQQLLNKTTTVRGAGKPHVDPLREPPQHCVVQVLQKDKDKFQYRLLDITFTYFMH